MAYRPKWVELPSRTAPNRGTHFWTTPHFAGTVCLGCTTSRTKQKQQCFRSTWVMQLPELLETPYESQGAQQARNSQRNVLGISWIHVIEKAHTQSLGNICPKGLNSFRLANAHLAPSVNLPGSNLAFLKSAQSTSPRKNGAACQLLDSFLVPRVKERSNEKPKGKKVKSLVRFGRRDQTGIRVYPNLVDIGRGANI